jgi:NADH-quinone oxidoreductase subunit N
VPLDLSNPSQLLQALVPEIVLVVGAMLLLLYAAWRPASIEHQRSVGYGAIGLGLVTLGTVLWYGFGDLAAGAGVIAVDRFRWAADAIFLIGAILTIAMAIEYNAREGLAQGESHVLILLATSGMMLLAATRDLMLVFLGIELMSVSTYVLAGLNRRSARSAEAGLKYFLLGAFSTAFLLYGIALVYGATGATGYAAIAERLADGALLDSPLMRIGLALLVVGFGFKVAAVPFHMWAPDVYEGAPTPHAAFMAATVKAAAFAAFLRLFVEAFPAAVTQWHFALWWIAALTMVVGNVVAIAQRNVKRLLAYSSIAHAGYVLVAVVAGAGEGRAGVTGSGAFLFYLLAYTFATMGAFAVVSALGSRGEARLGIDEYAGIWNDRPGITLAMSVFMLALLGFPVFGGIGFFAKWYLLQAALRGGANPQTRLAVVLVLTSVVSAAYYLSVVRTMFMKPRADDAPALPHVGRLTYGVIVLSAGVILIFGFAPSQLLRAVSRSALGSPAAVAPAAPRADRRAAAALLDAAAPPAGRR